jgi:exopolysaccharide production protein ExoZ
MNGLVRQYGDTDFITGLRAIAAVMVVTIHTGAFVEFGWLGATITDNGKYGVHIFFVISGFTIARTYNSAGSFGEYFGRRVMRIAPLYYAMVCLGFALILYGTIPRPYWMEFYGSDADIYNLVMHLTFLSSWDARIAASILGVEWTIPIEMFWYAVLPLVLPVALLPRTHWKIFFGLLLLGVLIKAVDLIGPKHTAHFLPLSYGAFFYLGALAETWRETSRQRFGDARCKQLFWASSALFVLALVTDTGASEALFAFATAGIIAFHSGTRHGALCLKPMLFMGSISYSIYLIHMLAIELVAVVPGVAGFTGFLHFIIVLAVTTLLSVITYTIIERPTNMLGRRMFNPATPQ